MVCGMSTMYHSTYDLSRQFSKICFFDSSNSDEAVFIVAILLCYICDQTKYNHLVFLALLTTYNRYNNSDKEM